MKFLNPFVAAPNEDKQFSKFVEEQKNHVDRETLVLTLMQAYERDVRNLDVFIAPEIKDFLKYSPTPEHLWEFCSELADIIGDVAYHTPGKEKYVGISSNGIFTSLVFTTKEKKLSVKDVIEWASRIDFTNI
jgi:hypothetical protein